MTQPHAGQITPGDGNGLLPCPFCGSTNIDPEGWMSANPDGTEKKTGPACDDCGGSTESITRWNTRAALFATRDAAEGADRTTLTEYCAHPDYSDWNGSGPEPRPAPPKPAPDAMREATIRRNYAQSAMLVCISLADEVVCQNGSAADVAKALRDRALAAPVSSPDGAGSPAFRRAVEMLKLGRDGKSLSFQNDEIEAILSALPSGAGTAEPGKPSHGYMTAEQIAADKGIIRATPPVMGDRASVPLNWVEQLADRGDGSSECVGWEADSGFRTWYVINQYFGSDAYGWTVEFDSEKIGDVDDPDQAKDIAQADFDRRIDAILPVQPGAGEWEAYIPAVLKLDDPPRIEYVAKDCAVIYNPVDERFFYLTDMETRKIVGFQYLLPRGPQSIPALSERKTFSLSEVMPGFTLASCGCREHLCEGRTDGTCELSRQAPHSSREK